MPVRPGGAPFAGADMPNAGADDPKAGVDIPNAGAEDPNAGAAPKAGAEPPKVKLLAALLLFPNGGGEAMPLLKPKLGWGAELEAGGAWPKVNAD